MSKVNVLVTLNFREIVLLELYTPFEHKYSCMAAHGTKDFLSGILLRFLIANAWNFIIKVAKRQRITLIRLPSHDLVRSENDEPLSYHLSTELPCYGIALR